ncbi:butyrophilin-like protein 8 [Heterocephalus glaber]|uniref:Butyrophilin-like protein 8 n=2 Tax=Heterocephalus glaber TaxID=10181 RepID=A0AAX6QSC7_HETGA|nr:butyrophilin-like protein 8 [Heterocephalus glaber]
MGFAQVSLVFPPTGQWQVLGPYKPVEALVGEDIVFSCFLSPEPNAEAMEVMFFKDRFSTVVHLYKDGEDQKYMQVPGYQGRTVLVKDFMADGHVSVALKNITLSDASLYGCWFNSQTYNREAILELKVSALGSTPVISVMGYGDGGIQLLCQSSGWFPQPTVKWKGPKGQVLSSGYKANSDRNNLFNVETSFTFQENTGNLSCSIQLVEHRQVVESRVWVGEMFFKPSSWHLPSILLGILCFGLFVGVTGMIMVNLSVSKGKISAELNWRRTHETAEWGEAQKHAVEVTLDPDTAHPQLYISDLKSVIFKEAPQDVSYTEKRFKRKCVVASQSFKTGQHYWEVDVGHNESWRLGVCRDDVHRWEEDLDLSPIRGYWVLQQREEHDYFMLDLHRITIIPGIHPTRVGIFLDCECRIISFFSVNDQSLIYTMEYPLEGMLRPYILPQTYKESELTPIFIPSLSHE